MNEDDLFTNFFPGQVLTRLNAPRWMIESPHQYLDFVDEDASFEKFRSELSCPSRSRPKASSIKKTQQWKKKDDWLEWVLYQNLNYKTEYGDISIDSQLNYQNDSRTVTVWAQQGSLLGYSIDLLERLGSVTFAGRWNRWKMISLAQNYLSPPPILEPDRIDRVYTVQASTEEYDYEFAEAIRKDRSKRFLFLLRREDTHIRHHERSDKFYFVYNLEDGRLDSTKDLNINELLEEDLLDFSDQEKRLLFRNL